MANIMSFEEWRKSKKSNTNSTTSTSLNLNPTFEEFRSNREKYNELTKKNNAIIEERERNNISQVEPTQSREEETTNNLLGRLAYANPIYSLFKLPENAMKAVEAGKSFFSQSFFKEGEGNVLQNIGGTIADTGINVAKGFLNHAEDIADFGVYKVADLVDLFGGNEKAEAIRKYADVNSVKALFGENEKNTENLNLRYLPEAITTGKIENEVVPDETLAQKIDKYSYFDKGMDDVAQGVGQLFGTMGTSELIGKTGLTKGFEKTLTKHGVDATVAQDYAKSLNTALSSYSSAYGGTYSSLRKAGYSNEEARTQARINGFIEAISEQLHDGVPGTKTAGWADKLNKTENKALKAFYNTLGEVDEEVFGNILATTIGNIQRNLDPDNQYVKDNYAGGNIQDILKDIYNSATSDEAKSEYLTVFLSSLITNGAGQIGQSAQEKQNAILNAENNKTQPIQQVQPQIQAKVEPQTKTINQSQTETKSNIKPFDMSQVVEEQIETPKKKQVQQEIQTNETSKIVQEPQQEVEDNKTFKKSKVVDNDGKLLKVYNRNNSSEIRTNEDGATFFTNDPNAEYYGKEVHPAYLNITNPLVVDAKGSTYGNIKFNQKGVNRYSKTTIKNVIDNIDKATKQDIVNLAQTIDKDNNISDYIDEFNSPKEMLDSIVENYTESNSIEELIKKYGDFKQVINNRNIPYERLTTTRDIADYAKANGYDGVIIKNVQDKTNGAQDVYAVFNSKQIKNIENTKAKETTPIKETKKVVKQEQPKKVENKETTKKTMSPVELTKKTQQTKKEQKPTKEKNVLVKKNIEEKAQTVKETKPIEDNIVETQEEYKSTDKLPETVKKGTYIEPTTPIRQDTKKGQKFVKQITNQNVLKKELSKDYTSFVDKLHPVQELADVSGNDQVYPKFNNRGMSNGKGQYQIGTAQTDNNGNKIGKPVNEIFKPAEDSGLSPEFDDYLAHKLNIERYDKVPVWDESVTPEISQEIVDEYEEKYPQFKEWAKDVYTFNDNQLQKMIDAGLSKENARDWLYDNYVTISRQIGPATNPLLVNAKGVKVNSPIRKAKGSNLEMRPMKEAMARQTLLVERSIADNIAGQELLNILGGTVGDTKSLLTQDMEGNNNALTQNSDGTYNYTIYKNGVPVTMQVTKELADAIRPTKEREWESLLPFKAIRKASEWQRGILTDKNPLFIFTNFFKDIGDAPLNSKYSAGELYANYPKNVYKMLTNSPEWQQYVANGGLANTYFNTKNGVFEKSSNKFVRGIQTINQLVEQAPRFTEYLNTLAHGGTIQEALYNAAEITTNFARGGEITKVLNRNGFNFLNASVQGFDKQIRNFTRQPGAKAYVRLLSKVAVLGVLPALLNHALLSDDDDYEELPNYVKDNYYLFKTSDNNFIRIPKGRVMSIFGTAARHTVEVGKGNEDVKDLVSDTKEQIINNVAPNNPLENNIFSPLISVANNKSWNGSKIVSTTLENYPDAYQYDEKTTSIAKWLGKTFNLSPKKIDYLLDQYTGGIGDVVMPMTTPYAETKSDNIIENAIVAPFKSKFSVDSTISNKYVNEYYDVKNELQKEMKTYNSIEDSEESFVKSLQYKYLDKVGDEISKLYNEKRQIQNSNLSNAEKYEQARAIQRQIDDLAKFAMEDYQTGYVNDSYASIGDKEFYTKMQNGKLTWAYVDDKTKAKQEDYAQKYDMSPESYYSMDGLTQSAIVGSNIYDFYNINKKLTQIRDNTTEDKAETFKYINSLNLSIPQKAMYLRTYYKTFNDYNTDIFNYVNSLNMIEDQKKAILIYLGFDYDKNTKTFSW